MAKEQKQFLKKIGQNWKENFPFLKPVDIDEIPRLVKGSNFCCDDYFSSRKVCYFVRFCFSDRRHGEFSMGITVSPSPGRSVLDPPIFYNPSPTNIGSYSMSVFMSKQSFRWDLVDVDGKMNEILVSLGGQRLPTSDYVAADIWKPESYALPFDDIADAAIRDVNDKLRRYVFPKLAIDVG